MRTTLVKLWFVRETDKARLYSRVKGSDRREDCVWIAKSLIHVTTKQPSGEHVLELPEWLIRDKGLEENEHGN